ncbi:queuosine 5'-phosphate N-glycosylase/hydrolase [Sporobolomyces salmoneus]|uniref:queuosine 5'-phosphate N-glycosylase/hydrolase n=1 Tax=Sporobolomyces salmoneus TaxID=183962 RepID=UPI00316C8600
MSHNPVIDSARAVLNISQHVKLNQKGINRAAEQILSQLIREPYTPSSWALVPLHPVPAKYSPSFILNWIFLVSSLNFSFWSSLPSDKRYGVRYKTACDRKGKEGEGETVWTGYFSLLAALHRAIDEGVDVTNPQWYGREATEAELRHVFRTDQEEEMPLLEERIKVLREVGGVLCDKYDGSFSPLLTSANHSALSLVNKVTSLFPCYDDVTTYPSISSPIYIRKRAQILIAETWAAFEGKGPGRFDDIDQLSMFADYRVPQILHSLGTLTYDEHLTNILIEGKDLANGSQEEVEIRSASIVVVEEIKEEIRRLVRAGGHEFDVPNSVLLDFLLWDLAKAEEAKGRATLPHHRTRSVFY